MGRFDRHNSSVQALLTGIFVVAERVVVQGSRLFELSKFCCRRPHVRFSTHLRPDTKLFGHRKLLHLTELARVYLYPPKLDGLRTAP